jgi:hypothetical protein
VEAAAVYSTESLKELRTKLLQFGEDATTALNSAFAEIGRAESWITERVNNWQRVVRHRTGELAAAEAALERCVAASRVSYGATAFACTPYVVAVGVAKQRLKAAQEELETTIRWAGRIEVAVGEFQKPARRLAAITSSEIPRAATMLRGSLAHLDAYGLDPPPGSAPSGSSDPASEPANREYPRQVVESAVGALLVPQALAVLGWATQPPSELASSLNPQIPAALSDASFGFEEHVFSPSRFGFHRLLIASALPLLIAEMGGTAAGSEADGPVAERIRDALAAIEPNREANVAVVLDRASEEASVFIRLDGASDWRLFRPAVPLENALRGEPIAAEPTPTRQDVTDVVRKRAILTLAKERLLTTIYEAAARAQDRPAPVHGGLIAQTHPVRNVETGTGIESERGAESADLSGRPSLRRGG